MTVEKPDDRFTLPWHIARTEPLGEHRVFSLHYEWAVSPRTGKEHRFTVMHCPEWVNVLALTPERDALLVRQYRHGTKRFTLEIPGGMVDAGEDPAHAAARELLEETGYRAASIEHLGTVEPNPAIQNNRCHTYLALDCVEVAPLKLDGGEDIRVERIHESQLPLLVRDHTITHGLVINAFYWYFFQRPLVAGAPASNPATPTPSPAR